MWGPTGAGRVLQDDAGRTDNLNLHQMMTQRAAGEHANPFISDDDTRVQLIMTTMTRSPTPDARRRCTH